MSIEELIVKLDTMKSGAQFPDFNGGYDSAIDDVIELLRSLPPNAPMCWSTVGCSVK